MMSTLKMISLDGLLNLFGLYMVKRSLKKISVILPED